MAVPRTMGVGVPMDGLRWAPYGVHVLLLSCACIFLPPAPDSEASE